jgi:cellulose synthase/poly-beta-1,6-N-acetylglucosamine synthase-like glycosyltransferase
VSVVVITSLEIIFWVLVAIAIYHYWGYPLTIRYWAARRKGREIASVGERSMSDYEFPTIELIVPMYNEGSIVGAKISNLANVIYPRDKLKICLILDGCTDDTKAAAEQSLQSRDMPFSCRIKEVLINRGKVAVLNDTISTTTSDVVALNDASALIFPDVLIRAAEHFRAGDVGVVCATYRMASEQHSEHRYWNRESALKADEAVIAAPLGAHGAFYLFRRALWSPLPADTINDDFVLPMLIVLQGSRVVYDQDMVAEEIDRPNKAQGFARRVRIGAGNFQQLIRVGRLLHWRRPALLFLFLAGKGLRGVLPLISIVCFGISAYLAYIGPAMYQIIFLVGITLLVVAFVEFLKKSESPRFLAFIAYLVQGQIASMIGVILHGVGLGSKVWTVTKNAKRIRDRRTASNVSK